MAYKGMIRYADDMDDLYDDMPPDDDPSLARQQGSAGTVAKAPLAAAPQQAPVARPQAQPARHAPQPDLSAWLSEQRRLYGLPAEARQGEGGQGFAQDVQARRLAGLPAWARGAATGSAAVDAPAGAGNRQPRPAAPPAQQQAAGASLEIPWPTGEDLSAVGLSAYSGLTEKAYGDLIKNGPKILRGVQVGMPALVNGLPSGVGSSFALYDTVNSAAHGDTEGTMVNGMGGLGGIAGWEGGAALGSVFGPWGTIGGAMVGSVLGGAGGKMLGKKTSDKLASTPPAEEN